MQYFLPCFAFLTILSLDLVKITIVKGKRDMDGAIMVTYKILCEADLNIAISLQELLKNENVIKSIKSEFAKGSRNIALSSNTDAILKIETVRKVHAFEVSKDDYADLLALAEEDAKNKKLLKKDCERVELIDIETFKIYPIGTEL
mgnify:CR=1 FL=1